MGQLSEPFQDSSCVKARRTTTRSTASANVGAHRKRCSRRISDNTAAISSDIHHSARITGVCLYCIGRPAPGGNTGPCAEAIVVTVTIAVVGDFPPKAIEFGETVQVDCAGPPLQLSATLAANPPAGATAIV